MLKRKLLLADDSITIQKVVNLTFADEGIEVIAVGNGNQAIERLEEVAPDLVLADVHMPGLSGYEVCEKVRSHTRFGKIPVMLLVGSFEPFNEAEAARVGADAHLTKPFQSIRQLVAKVTELLDSKQSSEEMFYQTGNYATIDIPTFGNNESRTYAEAENHSEVTAPENFVSPVNETSSAGQDSSSDYEIRQFDYATSPETEAGLTIEHSPTITAFEKNEDYSTDFLTQTYGDNRLNDELLETSRPNETDFEMSRTDFVSKSFGNESYGENSANEYLPKPAYLDSPEQMRATTPLSMEELAEEYPAAYESLSANKSLETAASKEDFAFETMPMDAFGGRETTRQDITEPLTESDAAQMSQQMTEPSAPTTDFSFVPAANYHEPIEQPATHSLQYEDNRSEVPEPPVESFRDDEFELELDHLRPFFASASYDDDAILEIKTDTLPEGLVESLMNGKSETSAEEIARRESEMEQMFAEEVAQPTLATETTTHGGRFAAEIEQARLDNADNLSHESEQTTELALNAPRAVGNLMQFPPEIIDAIAQRVVEKLSDRVVREIAWEVVPELSELLIKKYMDQDLRRR